MQVTLCDPYLCALEAFARRRAIQIHVYFTLLYFIVNVMKCFCVHACMSHMGRGDIIISTISMVIALRRHVVGIESIVVTRFYITIVN